MGREPDADAAVNEPPGKPPEPPHAELPSSLDDAAAAATRDRIARALKAGVRAMLVLTVEEDRALELLEDVGARASWPVHTWSAATGRDGEGRPRPLREAIDAAAASPGPSLTVILDGGASLRDPSTRRALRELAQRDDGPAIVLVEPEVPEGVLGPIPELWVDALPPPGVPFLTRYIAAVAQLLTRTGHEGAAARLVPEAPRLARTALGLPLWALDRVLAEAVLEHGPDPDRLEAAIGRAKPVLLDRTGLLEVAPPVAVEEVGGLGEFKAWLQRRALALTPGATQAAIPPPRGVLLLGVQGCGKSLAARASAAILGLPLVRLEPGRLFGGTVGESEANLRRATALVERLAPVVLWIDEVDKGLAGAEASSSDGGTTARVVGSLLTWLQERQQPVFVAATANRVDALPPELLRRGRLDEIFFVDLPDAAQRQAILRVHLQTVPRRRLGAAPPMSGEWSQYAALAASAEGLSGAEIEAAVVEARLEAFAEGRPLAPQDVQSALRAVVPLSRTRAESIEALRRWADGRARRA